MDHTTDKPSLQLGLLGTKSHKPWDCLTLFLTESRTPAHHTVCTRDPIITAAKQILAHGHIGPSRFSFSIEYPGYSANIQLAPSR